MIEPTQTVKKVKRTYRHVTPATVARQRAEMALQGNGTRAVEVLEPEYLAPHQRAYTIKKHGEEVGADDYVEERIEQIAVMAIDRVEELVNSSDERSALKASTFIIEQRRGKAVQKTLSSSISLNIQTVLE